MMEMAKLSDTMIEALRGLASEAQPKPGNTRSALLRRHLAKWTDAEHASVAITPSGRSVLDGIERADREQAERLERASRPVPASAFVEPSASRPVAAFPEYDDDAEAAEAQDDFPCCSTLDKLAVPQAWVDQLVILLDADTRIVRREQGWRAPDGNSGPFRFMWDRLDRAAEEAIRLGIAEALPPTPGQGVIRLALVKRT